MFLWLDLGQLSSKHLHSTHSTHISKDTGRELWLAADLGEDQRGFNLALRQAQGLAGRTFDWARCPLT